MPGMSGIEPLQAVLETAILPIKLHSQTKYDFGETWTPRKQVLNLPRLPISPQSLYK